MEELYSQNYANKILPADTTVICSDGKKLFYSRAHIDKGSTLLRAISKTECVVLIDYPSDVVISVFDALTPGVSIRIISSNSLMLLRIAFVFHIKTLHYTISCYIADILLKNKMDTEKWYEVYETIRAFTDDRNAIQITMYEWIKINISVISSSPDFRKIGVKTALRLYPEYLAEWCKSSGENISKLIGVLDLVYKKVEQNMADSLIDLLVSTTDTRLKRSIGRVLKIRAPKIENFESYGC